MVGPAVGRRVRGKLLEVEEEEGAGQTETAAVPNAVARCEGRWASSICPGRSSGFGSCSTKRRTRRS